MLLKVQNRGYVDRKGSFFLFPSSFVIFVLFVVKIPGSVLHNVLSLESHPCYTGPTTYRENLLMSTGLEFKLAVKWLPKLAAALPKIAEERKQAIDKLARELLIDPEELAPFYIEPDCQKYNPADVDEDQVEGKFRDPVFEFLEGFITVKKPLKGGKNQLFILSDAGMGKSSLLGTFALAHLTGFWPKNYHCEVLKLGNDTLAKIASMKTERRTVLLLDALDEDRAAINRIEPRIEELLAATQSFHRVVITCRTQFFPEGRSDAFGRQDRVKLGGFTCPVIYLSLFSNDQVRRYLENRFPSSWLNKIGLGRNQKISDAEQVIQRMGSLRFRPLLLAHIDDLLESEAVSGEPLEIYSALVACWLQREIGKQLQRRMKPPTEDELFAACRCLALHMSKRDEREIAEADLVALIKSEPGMAHLTGLEIGGRSLLNRNSDGAYRFAHYSIQEFLVARHFLDGDGAANMRITQMMCTFLQGRRIELCYEGVDFGFRYILPGRFMMGSPRDEPECDSNEQLHEVVLTRGFWLAEATCTQALWMAVMGDSPSHFKGEQRPVERVSWDDVIFFIEKLNQIHPEFALRLPSEAEWEYACRAGKQTPFCFGNNMTPDQVNYDGGNPYADGRKGTYRQETMAAKALPANDWGLYQMHGNVREWCADWYGQYPNGSVTDPMGERGGQFRVLRGGSWIDDGGLVRSAYRFNQVPVYRNGNIGFRLARGH